MIQDQDDTYISVQQITLNFVKQIFHEVFIYLTYCGKSYIY